MRCPQFRIYPLYGKQKVLEMEFVAGDGGPPLALDERLGRLEHRVDRICAAQVCTPALQLEDTHRPRARGVHADEPDRTTFGYWTPVWTVFDGQLTEMSLLNALGTVSLCVLRWMFVTSRHHDRFRVAAARLLGSRSSSISLTKSISCSRRPKRISIA